jgi:hypothetical protein
VGLRIEVDVGIGANAVEQRRDLLGRNRLDNEASCRVVLPKRSVGGNEHGEEVEEGGSPAFQETADLRRLR